VFSKAVTQGAEVFLIKSLQDSKNWFKVVERVGLDNLIKERQLIRNQREVYEGKDARPLKPMTVAGVMIEGGIIGYDSNIRSGGNGARFLGIGGSQQYRVDEITISMRLISVNSGEVLITTAVSKTIFSTQHNVGVLRFVDAGTKALELENGQALNEPTTYAVRVAIEQAVYDMIVEGEKKGIWRYKKPAQAEVKKEEVKAEPKVEVKAVETKVEEKKEVAAQPLPKVSAPVVEAKSAEPRPLFGQRRLKEAMETARSVMRYIPTDDHVLSTLSHTYRACKAEDELALCYENAINKDPSKDNLMLDLFFIYNRLCDAKKMQLIAQKTLIHFRFGLTCKVSKILN
jgi:curli production assembly/transport component CsgG